MSRVRVGDRILVAPSAFALGLGQAPKSAAVPVLTRREQERLTLVSRGLSIGAAAAVLGVTLNTCRGYVKSLHIKLGVSSQLEAVVKAQNLGLVDSHVER